jgi:glycosyltransferase involved in cell wall biosynthesis
LNAAEEGVEGPTTKPVVFIAGKDPFEKTGGHGTYVRAHALAATELGFAPHVFCGARRASVADTDFGVLHRVATPLRSHNLAGLHAPFLSAAVAAFLRDRRGPHLIHSFGVWAGSGVSASRKLTKLDVDSVAVASAYTTLEHENEAILRGLASHHGARKRLYYAAWYAWIRTAGGRLEQRGYEASSVTFVNYESVRRLLLDLCSGRVEVRLLPYASAAAFRSSDDRSGELPAAIARLSPADAPLVVCVARHDPRKALDVLLRAFQGLAWRDVPFRACLVGPGRLLESHRRLAADLGLTGRVAVTGYVDDVFAYLRRADVFVLPSLEEGSGSVALLEALQAGTAVVASACDGIPENVVDGEEALLVEPGSVASLEAALAAVLEDATLRNRLAARARAAYEERFSAPAFVAALGRAYADLGIVPTD